MGQVHVEHPLIVLAPLVIAPFGDPGGDKALLWAADASSGSDFRIVRSLNQSLGKSY